MCSKKTRPLFAASETHAFGTQTVLAANSGPSSFFGGGTPALAFQLGFPYTK